MNSFEQKNKIIEAKHNAPSHIYKNNRTQCIIDSRSINVLPQYILNLIHELQDISDVDDRAKTYLTEMYKRKMRGSTIKKYFSILSSKSDTIPGTSIVPPLKGTHIVPSILAFDNTKPPQLRFFSLSDCEKLCKFLYDKRFTDYKVFVILFAKASGLRISETLQLCTSHLIQLLNNEEYIALTCKTSQQWNVLYTQELKDLLKEMQSILANNILSFQTFKIDKPLFSYSSAQIRYALQFWYIECLGEIPPYGFSIHFLRYYIASAAAQNNELDHVQKLFNHKNKSTTQRYYVKDDIQQISNRISNTQYLSL